jgi:hypothetical protein
MFNFPEDQSRKDFSMARGFIQIFFNFSIFAQSLVLTIAPRFSNNTSGLVGILYSEFLCQTNRKSQNGWARRFPEASGWRGKAGIFKFKGGER